MPTYALAAVDDVAVVAGVLVRDPAAVTALYDRYADPLHDYARRRLDTATEADDVVHDTFLLAVERMGQLRDPERLRPWLYAIARSQLQRRYRHAARYSSLPVGPGDDGTTVEPVSASASPEELTGGAAAAELVQQAAAGLADDDRELLDLHLRHGLVGRDLAAAAGVPEKHASVALDRAKDRLARSLGVVVVTRGSACADLRSLHAANPALTPLSRKRLARHIDGCATCAAARDERLRPERLFASVPVLAAPLALRTNVLRVLGGHPGAVTGAGAGATGAGATGGPTAGGPTSPTATSGPGATAPTGTALVAERALPPEPTWGPDGFPVTAVARRGPGGLRARVVAVAAALLLAVALLVVLRPSGRARTIAALGSGTSLPAGTSARRPGGGPGPTRRSGAVDGGSPGTATTQRGGTAPTPTTSGGGTVTTAPQGSAPPTTVATPPALTGLAFADAAISTQRSDVVGPTCGSPSATTTTVHVDVTGHGPLSVSATLQVGAGAPVALPLSSSGSTYSASVGPFLSSSFPSGPSSTDYPVVVRVTATDGTGSTTGAASATLTGCYVIV